MVGTVSKNVDVSIVSAQFEECVVRPVPLIDDLLHHVFTPVKFEAYGTLVCLHSRVTLNAHRSYCRATTPAAKRALNSKSIFGPPFGENAVLHLYRAAYG